MSKTRELINRCIVFTSFLAGFLAVPMLIHTVLNYLKVVFGIGEGFNTLIVDGAAFGLCVIGFFAIYRKFREVFFVYKPAVHIYLIFCWHIIFFCASGSVFYQFVLAIFSSFASCERANQLKLSKADSITEINVLLRSHMLALLLLCLLYICSMLFDVPFILSVMNYFNISNIWLTAIVIIAMMASACAGALFLYRVVYLNVANKIING